MTEQIKLEFFLKAAFIFCIIIEKKKARERELTLKPLL